MLPVYERLFDVKYNFLIFPFILIGYALFCSTTQLVTKSTESYISVLGMEEQDVPGIAIPEKKVGIDGLLGRSFLKRFMVCFDHELGSNTIQLTPKEP
jgi:hypothetical protein